MRSGPALHSLRPARLRAAASVGGGASSLLRLSGGAPRLPSAAALGAWIGRAARPVRDDDTAA
jgi:hypothetical protein